MEQKVKVSVVVPVYNVAKYLDKCVQTIVDQTYRNLEIILIDDGSTDESLEKCLAWKEKDERILVISKVNEGLGLTRNKGIRVASGEYVMFIDSDDYISVDMVEKLLNNVIANGSDVAFCDLYAEEDGKITPLMSNLEIEGATSFWDNSLLLTEMPVYMVVKIYKKDLFEKNDLWMTEHYIEDAEFLPKLLSTGVKISQVKEPLYYYKMDRPDSIMMSKRRKIIEQLPDIFENIVEYLKNSKKFEKLKEDMQTYLIAKYLRVFYEDVAKFKPYSVGDEESLKEKIEDKLSAIFSEEWKRQVCPGEKYVLWGSPSLKPYVIKSNVVSYIVSGDLLCRYNFSSIISAMNFGKEKDGLDISKSQLENSYRKQMVDLDVKDSIENKKEMWKKRNIIVIDFLEERYDIVEYQRCYYTATKEFFSCYDLKEGTYRVIRRNSKEMEQLWKKSCDDFVKIIGECFEKENVILRQNFATGNMRDYSSSCELKELNEILNGYYKYFCEKIQQEYKFKGVNIYDR